MATVTRAESPGDPTAGETRILTAGVSWESCIGLVEGLPARPGSAASQPG
jgi:hypothetical protein